MSTEQPQPRVQAFALTGMMAAIATSPGIDSPTDAWPSVQMLGVAQALLVMGKAPLQELRRAIDFALEGLE